MKKQNPFIFSIPNPCNENWEQMSVVDKGKFCSNCQKTVTDISSMSDAAIMQLFLRQPEIHCVRAFATQIDRRINLPPQVPTRFYRIAVALGLTIMMAGESKTYSSPKAPMIEQNLLLNICDSTIKDTTDGDSVVISGIVVDEVGQPFPGVIVKLNQEGLLKTGVITENDGTFSIIVKNEDYDLEFCSSSYKTQRLFLQKNSIERNLAIKMELSNNSSLQGELIITIPFEKRKNEPGKTIIENEELRRMGY